MDVALLIKDLLELEDAALRALLRSFGPDPRTTRVETAHSLAAVAWRLRLPATVNSGQCFERMTSKTLGYRTSAHSLTSACRSLLPLTARSWRNRRLQLKTAFSRLPPVHRADLKGQLRVDLTRSQLSQGTAALCAFRPAGVDIGRSLRIATVVAIWEAGSPLFKRRASPFCKTLVQPVYGP